jgi:PAS domain S-box-containing protein
MSADPVGSTSSNAGVVTGAKKHPEATQFLLYLCVFWTIALLSSLIWNIVENHQTAMDIALVHARESFDKDVLARRWNATHGGVYVPVTEKTPPNPHLSISERDITTPSGRKLTLINPAYMTRQLHEMANDTNNHNGHITSLKPIRPENRADDWETEALRSFENGETEVYAVIEREGKGYLRLMRPLLTEKPCLKCHAHQGYTEGMVRGGISVIVPVPPWNKMGWNSNVALFSGHFLLWIIGLLALNYHGQRISTAIQKRQQAENDLAEANRGLETKVTERTAEYEEANEQLQVEIVEHSKVQELLKNSVKQWRDTFDVMSDFVSVHDNDMRFVRVNKTLANFFGKKPEELIGMHCYEVIHNTQEPLPNCPHIKAIENHEVCTSEIFDPHLDRTLLITCSPISDINEVSIGTVHVARDITSQKLAQKEKEDLINELQIALDEVKTLRGILPICSFCKNIRNDEGYYEQIEGYIHKHSGVDFSHTVCPTCMKENYPDVYEAIQAGKKKGQT